MSNNKEDVSVNTILENIQISRDTIAKSLNRITELQFEILNLQKDILQIQKILEEQAALFSENEYLKQELKLQKVRIYSPPTPLFGKTGGGLKRSDDSSDQQQASDNQPEPVQEQGFQNPPEIRMRSMSVKTPVVPAESPKADKL